MITKTISALLALFYLFSASATINIEAIRDYSISPGLHTSIAENMKFEEGNSDMWKINSGVSLRYLDEHMADTLLPLQTIIFSADYTFGEKDDQKDSSKGYAHLRWTKYINLKFAFEIFTQYEFDNFATLKQRALLGGGLRFPITYNRITTLFLGSSFMREEEQLKTDSKFITNYRISCYVSYIHQIYKKTFFGSNLYLQPRINKVKDYRILLQNSLTFPLNQNLDFTFSNTIKYDNQPTTESKSFNLLVENSLRYNF